MWFTKSRRAQSVDDYETWIQGGVAPTLNQFDNGDVRAVVLIIDGTRVGDVRVSDEEVMQTVIQRWGTGGGNVPYIVVENEEQMENVFPIQGTVIGRQDSNGPAGKGYREDGEAMFTLDTISNHAVAITYPIQDGREMEKNQNGLGVGDETSPAYTLDTTGSQAVAIAFDEYNSTVSEVHQTLRVGTKQSTGVINQTVRRLTPKECERLQGFPDDWTASQSISQRYRQMGNAVTVNVAKAVGEFIMDSVNYEQT